MKKIVLFLTILFVFVSCDSGDIYPDESGNFVNVEVNASFQFANINAFPEENYQILFGFFGDDTQKPLVSKVIQKPKKEGDVVSVSIPKIPVNTKSIKLVLSHAKAGTTVYTFYNEAMSQIPSGNKEIPLQKINLLKYDRIQQQVFSQCIQCHGGSDRAAANLYLTEDKSFDNLVNIQSKNSAKLRVAPNNPGNSFLMDILEEKALKSPHASIFTTLSTDDITLVDEWIQSGAEEIKN